MYINIFIFIYYNWQAKNSFTLFAIDKRAAFAEAHPEKNGIEISKLLGEKWKELSFTEKNEYQEQSLMLQDLRAQALEGIQTEYNEAAENEQTDYVEVLKSKSLS